MPLSDEIVCPGNHLNHATCPGAAHGVTISIELVERVQGIYLVVKCQPVFCTKSLVVNMFDNTQPLSNIQNVRRNRDSTFTEPAHCQVEHVVYVCLTRV